LSRSRKNVSFSPQGFEGGRQRGLVGAGLGNIPPGAGAPWEQDSPQAPGFATDAHLLRLASVVVLPEAPPVAGEGRRVEVVGMLPCVAWERTETCQPPVVVGHSAAPD